MGSEGIIRENKQGRDMKEQQGKRVETKGKQGRRWGGMGREVKKGKTGQRAAEAAWAGLPTVF